MDWTLQVYETLIPSPPKNRRLLEDWIQEQSAEDLLETPAWALEQLLLEQMPSAIRKLDKRATLGDLLEGRLAPAEEGDTESGQGARGKAKGEKKGADGEKLACAAREYLFRHVLRRDIGNLRKSWWRERAERDDLQLLSWRIRELMRRTQVPDPDDESDDAGAEVAAYLDRSPLQFSATFRSSSSWDWDSVVETHIDLVGFEHRSLRARCSCHRDDHAHGGSFRDEGSDELGDAEDGDDLGEEHGKAESGGSFSQGNGTSRHALEREADSSTAKGRGSAGLPHGIDDKAQGTALCEHVRQLCEWLIDAVHWTRHPFHKEIRDALETPSWVQLVDQLSTWTVDEAQQAEQAGRKRLAWRMEADAAGIPVIEPVVQKRLRSGNWSRGAGVPRAKWDEGDLDIRLRPEEEPVIEAWCAYHDAPEGVAKTRELQRLLRMLVSQPRLFDPAMSEQPVAVELCTLTIAVRPVEGGYALGALLNDVPIRLRSADDEEMPLLCVRDRETGNWLLHELDERRHGILRTVGLYRAVIPPSGVDTLLSVLQKLQPAVAVQLPGDLQGLERPADTSIVVRLQPIEPEGLEVGLHVRPLGEGPVYCAGFGLRTVVGTIGGKRVYCVRDLEEEKKRASGVERHLQISSPNLEVGEQSVRLEGLSQSLELLFRLKELKDEVQVEWPEGDASKRMVSTTLGKDLQVRVKKAEDWFCVDGSISIDGVHVPLATLLRAAQKGQRFVQVGPQHFVRLEGELRNRLGKLAESALQDGKEWKVGIASLSSAAELAGGWDHVDGDHAWRDIAQKIADSQQVVTPLPDTLKVTLRDYQLEGFAWLARLGSWGAGACLADEMGLGKTLQATAAMVSRAPMGPALVVAPTSVIQNWAEELHKFTDSLQVLLYQGRTRKDMLSEVKPGAALLCSYDVLSRDIELLEKIEFSTLVLDEAQAIKNSRSARAFSARRIRAGWRIALTGTPLENHLGELWSLFHVVSPGLLGSQEQFRQNFVIPIERYGMRDKLKLLRQKVAPFLLRRTKEQVAKELPPRTEVTRAIELSAEERSLYESLRIEALQELLKLKGATKGQDTKNRFQVLATITRLRRLACHPRLLDDQSLIASSKLRTFMDMLADLRSDGHRALVFSQFTGHLALVREALELHGVPYLYLDGSTPNERRASLVREWQNGVAPVFLISLRAGGTGLNLTGADYVVHLDPWWNPAVEDQASDRAHRIGQTKPVTVVRLVSSGTIEESVLQLHKEKRELAKGVLDGADVIARLSTDELIELIERESEMESVGGAAQGNVPKKADKKRATRSAAAIW